MAHPITKKIYVAAVTPFSAVYPFCEAPLLFALPASFVDSQRGRPTQSRLGRAQAARRDLRTWWS